MSAKKGCIPWNKGKKNSQIPWNKGKKGTASKASIDNLKKLAKDRKGKSRSPFSKKHRENLSEARKGKKASEAAKKKMRLRTGKKGANWQGGLTERTNYRHQRRMKKLNNGGQHTFGEWETLKAQYNWTCPCCGKSEPDIKLTEDHIVPISKGGSDNIENIQPLCKSCNCKKYTQLIKY